MKVAVLPHMFYHLADNLSCFVLHHSRSKLSTYILSSPHNSMPSQSVIPLTTPIKLTFPDGNVLISSTDLVTNLHSVQCDLCGKVNQLGLQGAENSIYQH